MDVDGVLRQATQLRQRLASEVDDSDPQRSTNTKRRQWHRYQEITAELTETADAVIAAGLKLGGKPGRALNVAYENLGIALSDAHPTDGSQPSRTMLDDILKAGLTPTVATDYDRWKPLHWLLAVPDVMNRGGFDAIIGNPPFLGGKKLTGALGTNVRDWLVNVLADGTKGGAADLVAYFFLRAMSLLDGQGNLGLIATNTVAQGDTREVGLRQMVDKGFTITRAIQSKSWPVASANLEYAAVWGTRSEVRPTVTCVVDDVPVQRISTLLEPGKDEDPRRLVENTQHAFIGCYVLGMGFTLDPDEAKDWIEADQRNADVLFPYLNGEDLNSCPDTSATRWVIDFNDWPIERAREYPGLFSVIERSVRPERQRTKPDGTFVLRKPLPQRWWQYADKRPALRKAIAELDEVLVITLVSKPVMPMRVPNGQVFSHKLAVFATDWFEDQAVLSSSIHQMWAIKYGSTLETRVNYSPSDVFFTFPRPEPTKRLAEIGTSLHSERQEIMLRRDLGLTKLYNLVNDPDIADSADSDIARLRDIHIQIDQAVMDAYGWGDVPLDHGFHTYRQMRRWTVSSAARVEILDRLLAENLKRAEAQGEAPPSADDEEEGDDE
jgi:hypothetical protein